MDSHGTPFPQEKEHRAAENVVIWRVLPLFPEHGMVKPRSRVSNMGVREVQALNAINNQRAANGGSDPSWLNLAFLGSPGLPSRGPKTLLK